MSGQQQQGAANYATGSAGQVQWGTPPKVTRAEEWLYGDLAPVIRQVGGAVAQLHDGMNTLASMVNEARQLSEPLTRVPQGWQAEFSRLGPFHDGLMGAYRELCQAALELAAPAIARADADATAFVHSEQSD